MNIYECAKLIDAIPEDEKVMINFYKIKYNELIDMIIQELDSKGFTYPQMMVAFRTLGLRFERYKVVEHKPTDISMNQVLDEFELLEESFNKDSFLIQVQDGDDVWITTVKCSDFERAKVLRNELQENSEDMLNIRIIKDGKEFS